MIDLAKLAELEDDELLKGLHTWCLSERTALARIVAYLAEVEERDLHFDLGYGSMLELCEEHFGMQKGAACRRLVASRLARHCPSIPGRLERGEISLFALEQLKGHLTAETEHLLDAVSGLSTNEIKEYVAEHFPKPAVPARLERSVKPLAKDRYKLTLTISRNVRDKLSHAVELMGHRNRSDDLEVVFEAAVDALVSKLENERHAKLVRPKRSVKPCESSEMMPGAQPSNVGAPTSSHVRATLEPSNHGEIPRAVRRAVFERDGHQCTFVGRDGRRCTSRTRLELDHIRPRACGGLGTEDNLRVECRAHNARQARAVFGRDAIEQRIRSRRRDQPLQTQDPREDASAATVLSDQREKVFELARRGLVHLGFPNRDARTALSRLRPEMKNDASVQDILRAALRVLSTPR